MKISDKLRLKVAGHKSVEAVVGIVQRNNLADVELRLESRVKYIRGEPFRENTSTVYAILDGYKAKIHTVTYAEDLEFSEQDDQRALSAENIVRDMIRTGQKFRDAGITPTIIGYENDFDGFIADFQQVQHGSVPEFYEFLAKFQQQN